MSKCTTVMLRSISNGRTGHCFSVNPSNEVKKIANEEIDGRAKVGFEEIVLRTKAIYKKMNLLI
ncbi:hypothetical protein TU58_30005 [Bacillus cereus]|nr:hypothetical protein TU58_30005 [Bacillus cereus]